MAFTVHRAERADQLAQGLAQLLGSPLPDPFATELVLVPARGVERWLSQRLSHRLGAASGRDDGVCAGVDFRSPASLIAEILGTRDEDPWAPDTLMWPLLRVLDASLTQPWARVLAEHLGHGVAGEEGELRRGRRLAVARRLAGLFSSYALQRPAMLADWERGGDTDGERTLPADLAWQPQLWRGVVAEVGLPSPIERHAATVAALRSARGEAEALPLPSRVSLFGHTRMSSTEAELVAALGEHREVHLWLPHPSDALWQRLHGRAASGWRDEDHTHVGITHPLLAAMGRDLREGQATLESVQVDDAGAIAPPARPATVLGALQADISADRLPLQSGLSDTSVQVHACHGPARQVEVLREVLLGLLSDDPTLEPRDIVVMCPDIDVYAPLINGAFGLGETTGSHPGHRFQVSLADRAPTQTNPLLAVLGQVLDLADGRAEATRVLDLLAADAVRRRFGFTEADLETMTEWVSRSGIRWAWDPRGRDKFGLGDFPQNTWRFGLDRLLTGVALSDDSDLWIGPTLPLDDVSTTTISLAGRFAEAIDRLSSLTGRFAGRHGVAEWLELLGQAVQQVADVARGDEWQLAQVQRELAGLARDAVTGAPLELGLSDIKAMLHAQLGGRPTRANFRTGTLTVCTMTPMRSVPHRVVCLLGLDDGVFPRGGSIDGDDVLARLPRVGERDVRSQDRQLFLDAIMAAGDHLVITYTGFSEASGQERPPSVPLREFLDVAGATSAESVVHPHHSQAFHPDYLGAKPFSFDPGAADAARAAAGERAAEPVLQSLVVDPVPPTDIDLDDLIAVITNPVKAFLTRRLQIALPRDADVLTDTLPVGLNGLERWAVGDRMLHSVISGKAPADALQAEWRRGTLPPGRYGWRLANEIGTDIGPLIQTFEAATQGTTPKARDLLLELPDGRRLTGSVTGLHDNRLVRVTYSRLKAKQRLEAWIALVALSAAAPRGWMARTIGRAAEGSAPVRGTYRAVEEAMPILTDLVALHDLALTRVLPMAADTSRLVARTSGSSRPQWMVDRDIGDVWRNDAKSVEVLTAWGHEPSWSSVSADAGPLGFRSLATRLWAPILAHEEE